MRFATNRDLTLLSDLTIDATRHPAHLCSYKICPFSRLPFRCSDRIQQHRRQHGPVVLQINSELMYFKLEMLPLNMKTLIGKASV